MAGAFICAIHEAESDARVLGRLGERGLHDELAGTAYAIVDGVDAPITCAFRTLS